MARSRHAHVREAEASADRGWRAHYLQGSTIGRPIERAPADVLVSFVLLPL